MNLPHCVKVFLCMLLNTFYQMLVILGVYVITTDNLLLQYLLLVSIKYKLGLGLFVCEIS